jgi:hypothetical protein
VIGDAEEPAPHLVIVAFGHKRRHTLARRAPGIVKGVLQQVIRLLNIADEVMKKGAERVLMAINHAGEFNQR